MSDLVASGAGDGFIRLWEVQPSKHGGAGTLRQVCVCVWVWVLTCWLCGQGRVMLVLCIQGRTSGSIWDSQCFALVPHRRKNA